MRASLTTGDSTTVLGLTFHDTIGALAKIAVVVTVPSTGPTALHRERTILAGSFLKESGSSSGGGSGLLCKSLTLECLEGFLVSLGSGREVFPVEIFPVGRAEISEVCFHGFSVYTAMSRHAGLGIAPLFLAEERACYTTVGWSSSDDAGAGLYTTTAGLGAGLESGPSRNNTVYWTCSGTAFNSFGKEWANRASSLAACDDGARASLLATTAGLGACVEGTPVRGLAVDGTGSFVASFLLFCGAA